MTKVTIQAYSSGKIKYKICEREAHSHEFHRYIMAFHWETSVTHASNERMVSVVDDDISTAIFFHEALRQNIEGISVFSHRSRQGI